MSVDYFAAAAGAFVDVSLPQAIGAVFKQVIQILLLYLGLIFDGMLLTSGMTGGYLTMGFLLVTFVNLVFGSFFLGMTGVWLYPAKGRPVRSVDDRPDTAKASRVYTIAGLALTAMFLGIHLGQWILIKWFPAHSAAALYVPIYGIGLPLFLAIYALAPKPVHIKKTSHLHPETPPAGGKPVRTEKHAPDITPRRLLLVLPVCFFVMYTGNLLGYLLQGLLYLLLPFSPGFPVMEPTTEYAVLQAVLLVFAAPVMEEFVFRRTVMGTLLPYGEKAALLTSALLFALFHGSVNQVCYAFLLGLVFGYVYRKTGRLRDTIFLHITINALGSLILPALLAKVAESVPDAALNQVLLSSVIQNPGVLTLVLFITLLFLLSLLGGVLFFYGIREQELSENGIRVKIRIFVPGNPGVSGGQRGLAAFGLERIIYYNFRKSHR